jgi:hypothetical protein
MARTNAAASTRAASRAADDRRMAARLALEEHWAVASLPIADRERARALAQRGWRRGAPRLADEWPARDRDLLTRVTAAYEIAALEDATLLANALRDVRRLGIAPARLAPTDDVTSTSDHGASHAARARLADAVMSVRGAADVMFMFARVLPLPRPWHVDHLAHILRLVSVGAVADDRVALDRWLDAARTARRDPQETEPLPLAELWDTELRDTIATLWIDIAPLMLLGAANESDADVLERAFETIAHLKEERITREPELLVTQPSAAVAAVRARLQVLYGVLDATAHLVVWARRSGAAQGVPAARNALELSTAFTAGDRTLDTALQWLDLAVALPPLSATLPAPSTMEASEPATGARRPRARRAAAGDSERTR